ncbi:MAG: hypothetical protein JWR63_2765 [Conexibacter sp.]|nr:hypothetical protein [Conexibacter sp.]
MHLHTRKESMLHFFNPLGRAALAAMTAAAVFALAHAAPSEAVGTYVHHGCVTGADLFDADGGWHPGGYAIAGNANLNQCPGGGLHTEMFPTSAIPEGATLGWTYLAPPDTDIVRFTGTFAGWTRPFDGSQGQIQVVDGGGAVGMTFTGQVDPADQRAIDWSGLHTNAVVARLNCFGASCNGRMAWASFYNPKLHLADATPPEGGRTAGSLVADAALKDTEAINYTASDKGGGVARFRLYVDGRLAGIDHTIDTNNGHCQIYAVENGLWVFSWPKPCPSSVDAEEQIDTTAIDDGQHTITAKVVDAGQREALLWTGQKVVANHPPVNTQLPLYASATAMSSALVGKPLAIQNDGVWTGPNLNLTRSWVQCDSHGTTPSCAAIPGATSLSYTPTADDVGHRLRLVVTATNPADSVSVYSDPTAIVTAPSSAGETVVKPQAPTTIVNLGGAPAAPVLPVTQISSSTTHAFRGRVVGETSGSVCPQDKATLRFEHVSGGRLRLGHGKASTTQVQLTCTTTGKAVADAQLDIATKVGATAAVAADTTTDGAGHAVLRLAKGASRAITVGYRMYADDPVARATASLKVLVNGKVSLKANHKHLHNGQSVRLRGALAGGEIPKRGVSLAVQWKDGRRWRPFAQIKTNSKGRFSYAYRFTRTSGKITYALRVQVTKGQVDYPFVATASKPVKVTVAS